MRPRARLRAVGEDRRRSDLHADDRRATPEPDVEGIVADLRSDRALGHVGEDLSTVLRRRIGTAGLPVPDEDVETIASDIEVEPSPAGADDVRGPP